MSFAVTEPATSDALATRLARARQFWRDVKSLHARPFSMAEWRRLREGLGTVDGSIAEAGAEAVAGHYGALFPHLDADDVLMHATALFAERFRVNDIALPVGPDKVALDAGCGSGRFCVALSRAGFGRVIGIDMTGVSLISAARWAAESGQVGIAVTRGDVLDLPLADGAVDFAYSNGVLHHTVDPERGLSELARVVRPGGAMFVALLETPGGVIAEAIDALRGLLTGIPTERAVATLMEQGASGFEICSLLDHALVPINRRFHPAEVEEMLLAAGFARPRRLTRGIPGDRCEMLARAGGDPEARAKWGVGENWYWCERP